MSINCPQLKLKRRCCGGCYKRYSPSSDAFQTVASDNNMYCRAFLYKLWQKSIKLFENRSIELPQHGFHRQFSPILFQSFLKSLPGTWDTFYSPITVWTSVIKTHIKCQKKYRYFKLLSLYKYCFIDMMIFFPVFSICN